MKKSAPARTDTETEAQAMEEATAILAGASAPKKPARKKKAARSGAKNLSGDIAAISGLPDDLAADSLPAGDISAGLSGKPDVSAMSDSMELPEMPGKGQPNDTANDTANILPHDTANVPPQDTASDMPNDTAPVFGQSDKSGQSAQPEQPGDQSSLPEHSVLPISGDGPELKNEISRRHREEWARFREQIFYPAISEKNESGVKLAKAIADVYKITQEGERKAYGFGDGEVEGGVSIAWSE